MSERQEKSVCAEQEPLGPRFPQRPDEVRLPRWKADLQAEMGMRTVLSFARACGLALALAAGGADRAARADDALPASRTPDQGVRIDLPPLPGAPQPPREDRPEARRSEEDNSRGGRLRAFWARRVRRVQATPADRSGGEEAPDAPSQPGGTEAAGGTDLTVPRAERGGQGAAQPTEAGQAQQQPAPSAAPAAPTPLYLNRAIGLEDAPVRVFGWLQNSFTGNANGTPADRSNFSVFPNRLANQWQGNQYYLAVENPLEADDMANLGFRFDTLFGNDWQFTKAYGLFDRAFHNNQFAGIDLPQIYGEMHLPVLTPGGLDIKGGRFYNPAGFEAVPAISRPMLSVPYTFNFTPFTFFGLFTTLHLTDRINLFNGAINGFDRWVDRHYKWGYIGGITYKSRDQKTNVTLIGVSAPDQLPRFPAADTPFVPTATTPPSPALAGRRNPFYGSSFRGYISLTLTHQWTDKLTEAAQSDHVFDPKIIGFSLNGASSSIAYHSLAHWFLYAFNDKVTGVWRSEVFFDPYGAATGSRSTFYEMTLGLPMKPKPWLWFRPEARYDWSQFTHPFSDGTRAGQLTLAFDVIVLF
jgi:hypothetical protein